MSKEQKKLTSVWEALDLQSQKRLVKVIEAMARRQMMSLAPMGGRDEAITGATLEDNPKPLK